MIEQALCQALGTTHFDASKYRSPAWVGGGIAPFQFGDLACIQRIHVTILFST